MSTTGSSTRVATSVAQIPLGLPTRVDYSSNTQAPRVVPKAIPESSIVANASGSPIKAVS